MDDNVFIFINFLGIIVIFVIFLHCLKRDEKQRGSKYLLNLRARERREWAREDLESARNVKDETAENGLTDQNTYSGESCYCSKLVCMLNDDLGTQNNTRDFREAIAGSKSCLQNYGKQFTTT